jgi:hypothetical protein
MTTFNWQHKEPEKKINGMIPQKRERERERERERG